MNNKKPRGALIFVRDEISYEHMSPTFRERTAKSNQAFVFADSADAKEYAEKNNLLFVDREEKP